MSLQLVLDVTAFVVSMAAGTLISAALIAAVFAWWPLPPRIRPALPRYSVSVSTSPDFDRDVTTWDTDETSATLRGDFAAGTLYHVRIVERP